MQIVLPPVVKRRFKGFHILGPFAIPQPAEHEGMVEGQKGVLAKQRQQIGEGDQLELGIELFQPTEELFDLKSGKITEYINSKK